MKKSFFSVFLISASLFIACNQTNRSFDNKLLDHEIPDDTIINIFIEPYTQQILKSDLNVFVVGSDELSLNKIKIKNYYTGNYCNYYIVEILRSI